MTAIGIDIGGTSLRAAVVAGTGAVLAHAATAVDGTAGPPGIVEQLAALVARLGSVADDAVIGIGVPGPCDTLSGHVHVAPALPGWRDVPLARLVADRLGRAVVIDNDATVAALGEWRFGAGRGLRNLVYVTVSTGIGGGVVADGALLRGHGGLAAQFGHMTIAGHSHPCFCGRQGCWEALASGSAIAWRAADALRAEPESLLSHGHAPPTAADVAHAAQRGDPLAQRLLSETGRYLGIGIVNLLHLFAPERVILGGGVTQAMPSLMPSLAATVAERALPGYGQIPIVLAGLGPHAGVIGAACLVMATMPPGSAGDAAGR